MSQTTIAAIATALGEGGIGTVRISGPDAIKIADAVFISASGKKIADIKGYTALFGKIKYQKGQPSDAVALKFCAPKSYTGEDTVELSVHGGRLLMRQTLRAVLDSGAVLAAPGEFTKRAFLNGTIDLTEAESVMGLISARNESELRMASAAHIGLVSDKITSIEQILLDAAASIAVYSDYPEEYIPELGDDLFLQKLSGVKNVLDELLSTYDSGRILREGIDTAIVGKPNVGKSTLMNHLSGVARSIVTEIAGTTRDIIEDTVTVGDFTLRLADTAGIHATADTVESVGVNLALDRIKTADLVLAVFDGSCMPSDDDIRLVSLIDKKPCIAIVNKSDCKIYDYSQILKDLPTVTLSAKTGSGTKDLEEKIAEVVGVTAFDPDSAVLLNERQRAAAKTAADALSEAIDTLKSGFTIDAVGICVDDALNALATLTGKRVTTAVADEIFKKFCVGK